MQLLKPLCCVSCIHVLKARGRGCRGSACLKMFMWFDLVNSALHVTIIPTLVQKYQFKEIVKGFHLGSCLSVDWNSQECKPRNSYFVCFPKEETPIPLLLQKWFMILSPPLSPSDLVLYEVLAVVFVLCTLWCCQFNEKEMTYFPSPLVLTLFLFGFTLL